MTKSQPVALLGEAPPRVLVKPKGARANSWQDVVDISSAFGLALDPWQELILEAAMGERTDRTWAAKRVGVSVPRQNGKSQLLVARAVAGALLFGEKKIVVSAHQQDTARESFAKLMELIEADANVALRDRVKSVMNALNRESVKFTNGAQIQFKSRSGPGGKGFSSDCLLLDEAQILGSRAWTSINSTMSAMPNPQVWLLGTPPQEEDDCYTFEVVRRAAMDGKSTAAAWCEWAADPSAADYDPASEYTRWSANPAWNTRINHEVVQGEYETYSTERFAQDRLGVWSDQAQRDSIFGPGRWEACATDAHLPDKPLALGVAVSVDRTSASIAAAAFVPRVDPDNAEAEPTERVFVAAVERRDEVAWVVSEVRRIQQETECAVVIDEKGPTADILDALRDGDVVVDTVTISEYAEACSQFFDKVRAAELLHPSSTELNDAVSGAVWRAVGDGRQAWGRRKSTSDVSMLEAATLAAYGAERFGSFNVW